MLNRLLFMMFALGNFHSLIPSSAAADVKEHAATHSSSAQQPLIFPAPFAKAFFRGFAFQLPLWLRTHPTYVDAHLPETHSPLISMQATFQYPLLLATLLDLHARIDESTLTHFIIWSNPPPHIKPADGFTLAFNRLEYYITALHQPTLTKILDHLIEQGSSIASLKALLTKEHAQWFDHPPQHYPVTASEKFFRHGLFRIAQEYLNAVEQFKQAAIMRSALDPHLANDLIDIAVEYAAPGIAAAEPAQ